MANLGSEWNKALNPYDYLQEEKRQQEMVEELRRLEQELENVVRSAIAGKQREVVVCWLAAEDVRVPLDESLNELLNRLARASRPVCAGDLQGRAHYILKWCEAHGLECFVECVHPRMNEPEYRLVAKPKA